MAGFFIDMPGCSKINQIAPQDSAKNRARLKETAGSFWLATTIVGNGRKCSGIGAKP
jgi:hypothetical protein